MKKILTRFGEVEYHPENTVFFPQGLVGLNNLHHFIVMPNKKEGPLFWIQSIDDPQMAFIVTNPNNFFLDYRVDPDQPEMQVLGISNPEESLALCIVTVTESREITLNLAAPILFSPSTNRAIQVILENSPYSTRTPLPELPIAEK